MFSERLRLQRMHEIQQPFRVPGAPAQLLAVPDRDILIIQGVMFCFSGLLDRPGFVQRGSAPSNEYVYFMKQSTGEIIYIWKRRLSRVILLPDNRHVLGSGGMNYWCLDMQNMVEIADYQLDWLQTDRDWIDVAFSRDGKVVAAVQAKGRWVAGEIMGDRDIYIDGDYVLTTTDTQPKLWLSSDEKHLAILVYESVDASYYYLVRRASNQKIAKVLAAMARSASMLCWVPGDRRFLVFAGAADIPAEEVDCPEIAIYEKWIDDEKAFDLWLCMYEIVDEDDELNVRRVWQVHIDRDIRTCLTSKLLWCDGSHIIAAFDGRGLGIGELFVWDMHGTLVERKMLYATRTFSHSGGRNQLWVGTDTGNIVRLHEATSKTSETLLQGPILQLAKGTESGLWGIRETGSKDVVVFQWDFSSKRMQTRAIVDGQSYSHVTLVARNNRHDLWLVGAEYDQATGDSILRMKKIRVTETGHEPEWERVRKFSDSCIMVSSVSAGLADTMHIVLYKLAPDRSVKWEYWRAAEMQWLILSTNSGSETEKQILVSPRLANCKLGNGVITEDARTYIAPVFIEPEFLRETPFGIMVARTDGSWDIYEDVVRENMVKSDCIAVAASTHLHLGVALCDRGTLVAIDLKDGKPCWIHHVGEFIDCLSSAIHEGWLILGYPDGLVEVRRLDNGELLCDQQAHDGIVSAISVMDCARIATGGADGRVCVWNWLW